MGRFVRLMKRHNVRVRQSLHQRRRHRLTRNEGVIVIDRDRNMNGGILGARKGNLSGSRSIARHRVRNF